MNDEDVFVRMNRNRTYKGPDGQPMVHCYDGKNVPLFDKNGATFFTTSPNGELNYLKHVTVDMEGIDDCQLGYPPRPHNHPI